MKKIIITAISAIAVIASVIGCQIYDSQTNAPLASGMNSAAEGKSIVKWQQMAADFNKACNTYYDNSTDENLRVIADMYFSFDKFYKAVVNNVKTYNNNVTEKVDTYKEDAVKDCYFKNFMKPAKAYDMYAYIKAYKEKYEAKLAEDKASDLAKVTGKTTAYALTDDENKAKIEDYKKQIEAKYKISADEYPYVDMDVSTDMKTVWSISGLYSEEYKLKWDYNSKK